MGFSANRLRMVRAVRGRELGGENTKPRTMEKVVT